MEIIREALRAHPLLAGCSALEHARLLAAAQVCDYAAGDPIFAAGSRAEHYYWVLSGTAQLGTAEAPSAQLEVGDDFGAEAFVDAAIDAYYLNDACAVTPLTVVRIARPSLIELCTHKPALRSKALLGMAARLGELPQPDASASKPKPAALPLKQRIGWVLTLSLPLLVWQVAGQLGLPQHSAVYLGLFTMTALMWLFTLVDEYIPPIIAVVAMLFIDLIPQQVALHGFYSRTFFLLLGVYALSAVLVSSGLAYRFMLWTLVRLPDAPFWHRSALTCFGFLLSIVMPSANARLALLLPLHREMDDSLGAPAQSREASALMIATFTGATLFSPLLLTSKSSNLAAFTMLPHQVRVDFQGLGWLFGAGVVTIGLLGCHLLAMRFLFPSRSSVPLPIERITSQRAILGPLRPQEWVAGLAFLIFLLGAAVPQWHQSQTAWLAGFLMASLLALGLFDKRGFQTRIDWPLIFFILSLDGFTEAIEYLGLRDLMIQAIGHHLDWMDGSLAWFILLALAVTMLLRLALPVTAGMILAVTLLLPVGMAQGIHPWIVVFLASLFSDIWFMPHQNSAFQQATAYGLRSRSNEMLFMRYAWWLNPIRVVLAYASIPYWAWLGLY
ncbi:MAG TPA: SLC13 family permease [Castellaniella sp.]|nr:SLC13 family permease [Castellaniella sp.]